MNQRIKAANAKKIEKIDAQDAGVETTETVEKAEEISLSFNCDKSIIVCYL